MAITQKDLVQADMGYYVALISDDEGMDASGEINIDYGEILMLEIAKMLIPMIFDQGYGKDTLPTKHEQEAVRRANHISKETAPGATSSLLTGINLRKSFGGVQGEIIAAVMPHKAWEDLQREDQFDKAITFMQYAVHILRGRRFERIKEDTRKDIIEELKSVKETRDRRAKRKSRR